MTFDYGNARFAIQVFSVDGNWAWAYWISGLDYYRESNACFSSSESAFNYGKRDAEEHIRVSCLALAASIRLFSRAG
jgi:hypothetical protein